MNTKSLVTFAVIVFVAYKVVFFVLSLLDSLNNCGVFEACGL